MAKESTPALGIDVSKKTLDVTLLNKKGGKKRKRVTNDPDGTATLLEWLSKQNQGDVHTCMEATSVYWEVVAETLHQAGYRVSVVNPIRIKGYAMSQLRRSKTDPLDGDVIADFCQNQSPELWLPPTAEEKKLRSLVRHWETLKKSRTQQLNRLDTCRDEDVKKSLETILAAIEAEIEAIVQQIENLIEQHSDLEEKKRLLTSIPGIGDTTAIHILAEMYDLSEYKDAKAAAADAGVTTSHYQSGTTVHRRPKISRMGKASVRSALYFPAITAIRHNPVVKKMAERLASRGKHKAVIRVAAMRKLLHLAYGVLKNKLPFDPDYCA